MIIYMKKFTIVFLGAIFVALIASSIQSISADHLEPGEGLFSSGEEVKLVTTEGTKYQVHLQTVVRTGDGQLISVDEEPMAAYVPHEITDYVFDTLMGKKEIITIDNIKYEKVQYTFAPTLEQRWVGMYPIFEEIPIEYNMREDTRTKMNEEKKDRSNWKIHYCATFEGHGYQCIPIIQVIIPTMVMEPDDVAINQWTILRDLN